jgi:hypothetical protein
MHMLHGTIIVNNEVERMWRGRDKFSGIINKLPWKLRKLTKPQWEEEIRITDLPVTS